MPTEFRAFKVSGATFEIDKKYVVLRPIGNGAYGVVISALDTSKNVKVAIKKIPRAFEDLVDGKRILREIKLLRHFKHENIISILDMFPPPSYMKHDLEDVYIVSDLMETDLHRIIYSRQPLTLDHVQYFIYQVLRALKYMHSAKVIHRDLKPSNLLCNSNCELKICDLGLARGVKGEEEEKDIELTEYVVTRWYRAPEIMLACQEYTLAIDVWSAGCIFAELIQRRPLFPGEDYVDQIRMICEKLGKPKPEDLDFVTSEKARRFIMTLPETSHSLANIFPQITAEALDLLSKMLVFNPAKRITVEEALNHPFMASLQEDEPVADSEFDFEFENEQLTKTRLQEHMWSEILHFHPYAEEYSKTLRETGQKAPAVERPTPGPSPRALQMLGALQGFTGGATAAASAPPHQLAAATSTGKPQDPNSNKQGARPSSTLEDAETPIVKKPRPGDDRPILHSSVLPEDLVRSKGIPDETARRTEVDDNGKATVKVANNQQDLGVHPNLHAILQRQLGAHLIQSDPQMIAVSREAAAQHRKEHQIDPRMIHPSEFAMYATRVNMQNPASAPNGSESHTSSESGTPVGDLGVLYARQQLQAQAAQIQMQVHHAQAAAAMHAHAHQGALGSVIGQAGQVLLPPPGSIFGGMPGAWMASQDHHMKCSTALNEMLETSTHAPSSTSGPSSAIGVNMNARGLLGSMVLGPGMHGTSRLGASLGVNLGPQLGPRFSSATNPFSSSNMNRTNMNPFARSAMITAKTSDAKHESPRHAQPKSSEVKKSATEEDESQIDHKDPS